MLKSDWYKKSTLTSDAMGHGVLSVLLKKIDFHRHWVSFFLRGGVTDLVSLWRPALDIKAEILHVKLGLESGICGCGRTEV